MAGSDRGIQPSARRPARRGQGMPSAGRGVMLASPTARKEASLSRLDRSSWPTPLATSPVLPAARPLAWRLALAVALLAVAGLLLSFARGTGPGETAASDPELAVLLRFMAAMKLGIALGA